MTRSRARARGSRASAARSSRASTRFRARRCPRCGLRPPRCNGASTATSTTASTGRIPVFELAFRWIQERLPAAESARETLVHGDFRHGNLMIGPDGVRGVLDWELAHRGDPLEDLGWVCVNSWRFGNIDLPVGGFGLREDLFAGYEAAGGERVDPERVRFWEVVGSLKWGIMCMVMLSVFERGIDRSVERAAIGRRSSEAEIDLLALLAGESVARARSTERGAAGGGGARFPRAGRAAASSPATARSTRASPRTRSRSSSASSRSARGRTPRSASACARCSAATGRSRRRTARCAARSARAGSGSTRPGCSSTCARRRSPSSRSISRAIRATAARSIGTATRNRDHSPVPSSGRKIWKLWRGRNSCFAIGS